MIGRDLTAPKVYLLRHFEDGRGRLPQLYYFAVSKQSPSRSRLIQADSLYNRLPHNNQPDYDATDGQFEQRLTAIRQRTKPLKSLPTSAASLEILGHSMSRGTHWMDNPDIKVYRITYRYRIRYQHGNTRFASSPQRLTAYGHKPASVIPTIRQLYRVPQEQTVIATVEYLGLPFETGYTLEDAVLLSPTH